MKYPKMVALIAAAAAAVSLSACSSDDEGTTSSSSSTTTTATSESQVPTDLPTAAELNAVLARATDSTLPIEERVATVEGGEDAIELFDVMTQSKEESGANFEVVDPVLPDYTPDAVLATILYTLPDREPQTAENVQFIYQDGQWKLSRLWACTLIQNTVAPDQVPAICSEDTGVAVEEAAPVEEEAPVEG